MRRFLMFVLVPLSLVGGVLVGYVSHAVQSIDNIMNDITLLGMMGTGLTLIVASFFVRKRAVDIYENKISKLNEQVDSYKESNRSLSVRLLSQNAGFDKQ